VFTARLRAKVAPDFNDVRVLVLGAARLGWRTQNFFRGAIAQCHHPFLGRQPQPGPRLRGLGRGDSEPNWSALAAPAYLFEAS
jgi:hypothetical protein